MLRIHTRILLRNTKLYIKGELQSFSMRKKKTLKKRDGHPILLQITLIACAAYIVMGAIAHFFGLTIFPFYDGGLHTPYHDIIIALAAVMLAILLFSIAEHPLRRPVVLKAILIASYIAIVFNLWILFTVDFVQLDAPGKWTQTLVETILLVILIIFLHWSEPKNFKLKGRK